MTGAGLAPTLCIINSISILYDVFDSNNSTCTVACSHRRPHLIVLIIFFIQVFFLIAVLHLGLPSEPLDGIWDDVIPQQLPAQHNVVIALFVRILLNSDCVAVTFLLFAILFE